MAKSDNIDEDPGDLDDDLPPLDPDGDADPGDMDDDLPPLIGEDGEELSEEEEEEDDELLGDLAPGPKPPPKEDEVLKAAAALGSNAAKDGGYAGGTTSTDDALKGVMSLVDDDERLAKTYEAPSDVTVRMIQAIAKDDYDEVEDAIFQGADVHVDAGGGMAALHFTALRGDVYLTELIIAHNGDVNMKDRAGMTPLMYGVTFFVQNGNGVQITAQLLYHKANPHFRIRDGQYGGMTALSYIQRECKKPQLNEEHPRQIRAMLMLAEDGSEQGYEVITKMWMGFKSSNKKLYEVSGKKDKYDYKFETRSWEMPKHVGEASFAPVLLKTEEKESQDSERFSYLKNYSFSDEGDKIKVYVNLPKGAVDVLKKDAKALEIEYGMESIDVKYRPVPGESYRMQIPELFGTIDVPQCKHRASKDSDKVTLTLKKRYVNRMWKTLFKPL